MLFGGRTYAPCFSEKPTYTAYTPEQRGWLGPVEPDFRSHVHGRLISKEPHATLYAMLCVQKKNREVNCIESFKNPSDLHLVCIKTDFDPLEAVLQAL